MNASTAVIGQPQLRYDINTILLHWLTAGLIIVLWLSAQVTDVFGVGTAEMYMVSLHVTLGVALAMVLAVRVLWRLTNGRSLPDADTGWMELAARATHYALYLLAGGAVLLGLLTVWARGQEIWGLFTLPMLEPAHGNLRHWFKQIHGLLANLILILAGMHAAAALFHHYVLGDGVLRRMLPRIR